MSEFNTRLVSGVAFALFVVMLLVLSSYLAVAWWCTLAFALLLCLAAGFESGRCVARYASGLRWTVSAVGVSAPICFFALLMFGRGAALGEDPAAALLVSIACAGVLCSVAFVSASSRDIAQIQVAGYSLLPVFLLVSCGGASLIALGSSVAGPRLCAWFLFVVCLNDVGAYLGGRRFGGAKFSPALSPGKTWSGSFSGLICAALAGVILYPLLGSSADWREALPLAIVITVAAQAGDLTKSFLKRCANVKDSGGLIPGHGGVLDRIDGILAAAPLMVGWVMIR